MVLFFKKGLLPFFLSSCAIHHVTPYIADTSRAPQTADAMAASTSCAEAGTPAELAICASPALTGANRAMNGALHAAIRRANIFGRDALLASQRAWLLGLATGGGLAGAIADRHAELANWPGPPPAGHDALAQYVTLRPVSGPAFCAAFAASANDALRRTGRLDPAAMGYQEVAGTYGPESAPENAPPVAVDVYDANTFALFERRARSVTIGQAAPAITPASLTQLVEARDAANQGGRFSAFASQTGDYGTIDVFRDGSRTLALASDPWGSTTPAAPGEAAHAGIWEIGGAAPQPVCLFDTYTRPPEPGPFDTLPGFSPWRDVLAQIRDAEDLTLGTAFKRDQGQLGADTDFIVLHMPLLAVQEAAAPGQTSWLRHRHDDVLDALFAWSGKSAANKALFDRAFVLLRPAATDLVRAYQTTQGLSASEATQAGGIAIMELLYQATIHLAPGLGASPSLSEATKPRYPILAAPQ